MLDPDSDDDLQAYFAACRDDNSDDDAGRPSGGPLQMRHTDGATATIAAALRSRTSKAAGVQLAARLDSFVAISAAAGAAPPISVGAEVLSAMQQLPTALFRLRGGLWDAQPTLAAEISARGISGVAVAALADIASDVHALRMATDKLRSKAQSTVALNATAAEMADVSSRVVVADALRRVADGAVVWALGQQQQLHPDCDALAVVALLRRAQADVATPVATARVTADRLLKAQDLHANWLLAAAADAQGSNQLALASFYLALLLLALWPFVELCVTAVFQSPSREAGQLPRALDRVTDAVAKATGVLRHETETTRRVLRERYCAAVVQQIVDGDINDRSSIHARLFSAAALNVALPTSVGAAHDRLGFVTDGGIAAPASMPIDVWVAGAVARPIAELLQQLQRDRLHAMMHPPPTAAAADVGFVAIFDAIVSAALYGEWDRLSTRFVEKMMDSRDGWWRAAHDPAGPTGLYVASLFRDACRGQPCAPHAALSFSALHRDASDAAHPVGTQIMNCIRAFVVNIAVPSRCSQAFGGRAIDDRYSPIFGFITLLAYALEHLHRRWKRHGSSGRRGGSGEAAAQLRQHQVCHALRFVFDAVLRFFLHEMQLQLTRFRAATAAATTTAELCAEHDRFLRTILHLSLSSPQTAPVLAHLHKLFVFAVDPAMERERQRDCEFQQGRVSMVVGAFVTSLSANTALLEHTRPLVTVLTFNRFFLFDDK
jgi:hypothetical protein